MEIMGNGWVKLHRVLLDHWVYGDNEALKLWITLISKATHKKHKQKVGNQLVDLKPGQLIFGTNKYANVTEINRSKLYRLVQMFVEDKMIIYDTESYKKFSIITILNWETYQSETLPNPIVKGKQTNSETQMNADETQMNVSETQVKTNKNVKNVKNDKNKESNNTCSDKSPNTDIKFHKGDKPYEAARYLRGKILENNSRTRVPKDNIADLQDWAIEMDRLYRLGPVGETNKGYSWKEIGYLINWCQDDDFWKSNILSAGKLREKVITLENQMKRDGNKNNKIKKEHSAMADLYQKYKKEEGE